MELLFHEESIKYLTENVFDRICQELTAEMTVPENRPEIRRVVDCFGNVLVYSKNIESGTLTVSGGIQAGVLYVSEEERLERIDVVLPFTVSKKYSAPAEQLFYWGWIRGIDARLVNSRKVLVRANLGSELTVLAQTECGISRLDDAPEELCCRAETYRMRLPLCAAEKDLQLTDEVLLQEQEPGIERLLKWSCTITVTDTRLIGDKAVFKGEAVLRCLYSSEDESLHVWTGSVPFSQYADLDREIPEGMFTVQPILRQFELDSDGQIDSHRLLLNLTATAQILARGDVSLTLTEDAYCLSGDLEPQWQTCELPACLDLLEQSQTESVPLPAGAEVLDWTICADAASVSAAQPDRVVTPMNLRILYWDSDRSLQSESRRIESVFEAPPADRSRLRPMTRLEQTASVHGGQLSIPVQTTLQYEQVMPLRNLNGGEINPAEETGGPSLVIARCRGSLWEIAKKRRTTVRTLQAVNGLETDLLPEEKRLLIPVGQAAKSTGEG